MFAVWVLLHLAYVSPGVRCLGVTPSSMSSCLCRSFNLLCVQHTCPLGVVVHAELVSLCAELDRDRVGSGNGMQGDGMAWPVDRSPCYCVCLTQVLCLCHVVMSRDEVQAGSANRAVVDLVYVVIWFAP